MTCKVERLRELRRFQKVPSRDAALAAAPGLISAHIGQSHSGWSFERTGWAEFWEDWLSRGFHCRAKAGWPAEQAAPWRKLQRWGGSAVRFKICRLTWCSNILTCLDVTQPTYREVGRWRYRWRRQKRSRRWRWRRGPPSSRSAWPLILMDFSSSLSWMTNHDCSTKFPLTSSYWWSFIIPTNLCIITPMAYIFLILCPNHFCVPPVQGSHFCQVFRGSCWKSLPHLCWQDYERPRNISKPQCQGDDS